MTSVYNVPFQRQVRNLTLPSMAGQLVAGVRLAVLAGWGCVILVEWFGSNGGIGFQARDWYLSANFDGLMAWAVVMIVIIVFIDRVIISTIDRRVHRWRGAVGGFGGGSRARYVPKEARWSRTRLEPDDKEREAVVNPRSGD
jgi:NitT/TauT family transport system permease protein